MNDGNTQRLSIHALAFDRVEELDLVGPWELLGLLASHGYVEHPLLVTLNNMLPVGEHRMRLVADLHFQESRTPDVLLVPGGSGARAASEDLSVLTYLQQAHAAGTTILSVCTGALLLQRAGLLVDTRATTHWQYREHLEDDPSITLVPMRVVCDKNIWTSAGVSAGMDMVLAYIAACFGEDVAEQVQLDAEYFPARRHYGQVAAHFERAHYAMEG